MRVWAAVVVMAVLVWGVGEAQRRGGGRRGGRRGNRLRGLPRVTNEASTAYYDHKDAAKITWWSHFETEYILGRKIVFMCTATGDPVPHITWYKNGIELYAHSFLQLHEYDEDPKSIKSKMEIDPATQMDAGYYECQANNKYAVDSKGFMADYSLEFE
ncbi:immunoglobulin domain-containing protein oig-4-like [Hyalella azteca]|uniref:Immunoglobulin domain-containing protein oig-4-like n=1 Tax=Hyalella azteca TaxID=294128 RepID=A0A979FMF0_HYAAZ|nr:immunoglobulin domain-containing protein oig-4-like [Hyalella azteca]